MDRLWIYAVLLVGACVVAEVRSDAFPNNNNLDNNFESLLPLTNEEIDSQESEEFNYNVDDEIHKILDEELETRIEDYQFEDNRSEVKDDNIENDNDNNEQISKENKSQIKEIAVDYVSALESGTKDSQDEEQLEEQESDSVEEDQQKSDTYNNLIKEQENQNELGDNNNKEKWDFEQDIPTEKWSEEENTKDLQDIIEETKQLLENTDSDFDENLDGSEVHESVEKNKSDDNISEVDDEEENVGKVYADLSDDLQKLSEIWRKLSEDDEDNQNSNENSEQVDVIGYEEKFGRPFKEDSILKARKDYDALYDLFEKPESDEYTGFESEEEYQGDANETNEDENNDLQFYGDDAWKANDDMFSEDEEVKAKPIKTVNVDGLNDKIDEYMKALLNPDQTLNADELTKDEEAVAKPTKTVSVDEFIDDDKTVAKPTEIINVDELAEDEEAVAEPVKTLNVDENEEVKKLIKTVNVDELTSTEYDDLMRNFKTVHSDLLDPQSEDFTRHVAPIHISLSVDEATIVTSPNYPQPYTTNNVIDWIFDGQGNGIDFRIHDFAVNGVLGDYLLVKPGGEDESGNDGLIFSYSLTKKRQYVFMDVDRMFVRFEARPALAFMRGFNFTVQMIAPIAKTEDELPKEEPVVPFPESTLTVNLGGVSMFAFQEVRENFRQIIADMATMYINANGLEHGMNSTMETAQITNTSVCNINWPNFEQCVEVRFGVPLVYDEEQEPRLNEADLKAMWYTYVYQDPFALRLSRLGIKEFSIPNDGAVMMVWLVIAGGVVISVAMLAFALWRYSCFEDYTRMPSFSDTDSLKNEKRGLDLYPTPHQTLPPLYESEYKYDDSYRVDVGGYPNKSYVRDDMFDIDSDEETLPRRDRKESYSPRFSDV